MSPNFQYKNQNFSLKCHVYTAGTPIIHSNAYSQQSIDAGILLSLSKIMYEYAQIFKAKTKPIR
jgi:hypothetical protein